MILQLFSLLLLVLLAACAPQARGLPPTDLPTQTAFPSPSPLPSSSPSPSATSSPQPSAALTVPAATSTAPLGELPLPFGTPVADWDGLPVMPGALAGQISAESYSYIIEQPLAKVQDYYAAQMPGLGYQELAAGETPGGGVLLVYVKGEHTVSVTILEDTQQSVTLVMLVK